MNKINNKNNKLHPYWITGFVDGEGCFKVILRKKDNFKTGWKLEVRFQILLHIRDKNLILDIRSFFNDIGTIYENNIYIQYEIGKIDDLIKIIIPHFEKFPLFTKKKKDFLLWRDIVHLISKKEHLNKEGLIEILKLKASLNRGLPENFEDFFSKIEKIVRPNVCLPSIIDYNWLAGFFFRRRFFFYIYN